jgi:hypothetical protein
MQRMMRVGELVMRTTILLKRFCRKYRAQVRISSSLLYYTDSQKVRVHDGKIVS